MCILCSDKVLFFFTCVAMDEAVEIIYEILKDPREKKATLLPGGITEQLETYLRSPYFSYRGNFKELL